MKRRALQLSITSTVSKDDDASSVVLILVIACLLLAHLILRMPGALLSVGELNLIPLCGP